MLTLARLIEQLLRQGKSGVDLLQNCFTSLLEVSIQLKEVQDGKGDEQEAEEAENDDDDDDDEDSDNDDSEDYDEVDFRSFFTFFLLLFTSTSTYISSCGSD